MLNITLDENLKVLNNLYNDASSSVTQELIADVRYLLKRLTYQPEIRPTGENIIKLEYAFNDDVLQIDVYPNGYKEILLVTDDRFDSTNKLKDTLSINKYVIEFIKQHQ